jgi:TolB-like protein
MGYLIRLTVLSRYRSFPEPPIPTLHRLLFVALFLFTSHLWAQDMKPVSSALAKSITASGRKTVAVVDFTDLQGNVTELGRFLSEELSVQLVADAKGFEVIERTQLKVILKEHQLSSSGLIDPSTAKKLGQIAGVDALVTGTITALGDTVRLSAKVVDTQTAKMIGATTYNIAKTRAIEDLLQRGVSGAGGS